MNDSQRVQPGDQTLQACGLGTLDDAWAESFNQHLESCPDCLRPVAQVMPLNLARPAVPVELAGLVAKMWPLLAAGVLFFAFVAASISGVFQVTAPMGKEPTVEPVGSAQIPVRRESLLADRRGENEADVPQDKAGGEARPEPEAAAAPPGNGEPGAPGFVSLFNGEDLAGWKLPAQANQAWKVVHGVLEGSGRPAASSLLTNRTDFANFHLRVETRLAEGPSGAINFRPRRRGPRPADQGG
jgi:Domain of Unknown Function (DUF1080)